MLGNAYQLIAANLSCLYLSTHGREKLLGDARWWATARGNGVLPIYLPFSYLSGGVPQIRLPRRLLQRELQKPTSRHLFRSCPSHRCLRAAVPSRRTNSIR